MMGPQNVEGTTGTAKLCGGYFPAFVAAHIDKNDSVFDAGGERGDAGGFGCTHRHSGFEVEAPPMERANDGSAGDNPVTQGAALMRALVLNRQVAILQTENCNLRAPHGYGSPFAERNVPYFGNGCPVACVHFAG